MTNGHNPEAIRAYCNEKCGVILGHGIGDLSGKAFRVAHMGHVNAPMVLGTFSVIEMASMRWNPARQGRRPGRDRLAGPAGQGLGILPERGPPGPLMVFRTASLWLAHDHERTWRSALR